MPSLRSRKLHRWPGSGSWREHDWWHHFAGGGLDSGGILRNCDAGDAKIVPELKPARFFFWSWEDPSSWLVYHTENPPCLLEFSKANSNQMPLRWLEATDIPGTGGKTCQRVHQIAFMCICTVRNMDEGYPKWKQVSPGVCIRSCVKFHVRWPFFFLNRAFTSVAELWSRCWSCPRWASIMRPLTFFKKIDSSLDTTCGVFAWHMVVINSTSIWKKKTWAQGLHAIVLWQHFIAKTLHTWHLVTSTSRFALWSDWMR